MAILLWEYRRWAPADPLVLVRRVANKNALAGSSPRGQIIRAPHEAMALSYWRVRARSSILAIVDAERQTGDTRADVETCIQPFQGGVRIEITKGDRPTRTEPPHGFVCVRQPCSFAFKFIDECDVKTTPQSLRR